MAPELKTPPARRLIRTRTPGIYRRGNRYVAISYRHGRRVKTTHDTKRDACEARARRTCRDPLSSRERFEDYTERWLIEYRGRIARGLAPSTREAYAWTMRTYVIPYFRGARIGDLRRADIKRFIDHLAALKPRQTQQGATRLAGSTIRKILTPLKAMLAEAHELDLLATDAGRVRVVVGHSPSEGPPRTMTREQIDALLERLDPRDRLLVLVLRWTGLRIAEALGLRWHDLQEADDGPVLLVRRQWQDGRLVEHTKTSAGVRAVAVVPSLGQALAEARATARFAAPVTRSSRPTAEPTKTVTTSADAYGLRRQRRAWRG